MCKLEFYRRIAAYEQAKINSDSNGDLIEYEKINAAIAENQQIK